LLKLRGLVTEKSLKKNIKVKRMYCEPTQWNGIFEPWNSISNLAFFYSSYQIFKLNQKKPKSISLYFSICILMIGIGSFFGIFIQIV